MKYLVEYECGKNKIAGCDLYISKGSKIIDAVNHEDAYNIFMLGKLIGENSRSPYYGYCFGHKWDYVKITAINLLVADSPKYLPQHPTPRIFGNHH